MPSFQQPCPDNTSKPFASHPPWSDFFVDKPTGWAKAGTGAEQAPVKALNKRALNKRWCESAEQARAEQALV